VRREAVLPARSGSCWRRYFFAGVRDSGGDAWATRSVTGYSVISLDYNSIPEYLTNGKPEFIFSTKDRSSFELNEQSYTDLVVVLNRIIQHLNNNRMVAQFLLSPVGWFALMAILH